MLIVFASMAGVILGLNLNVFALLTVTLVGAATYLLPNSSLGESWTSCAGQIVILSTCLHAGYILGLTGRPLYAALLGLIAPRASRRT